MKENLKISFLYKNFGDKNTNYIAKGWTQSLMNSVLTLWHIRVALSNIYTNVNNVMQFEEGKHCMENFLLHERESKIIFECFRKFKFNV